MSPRILIVEDETDLSRVMAYNLRAEGYDCMTAETGEACLREITARRFDLLVLDLMLPDASGLDVIRKVREWSAVPVIVLSARGQEADKVAALDAGADDYLSKPFGVGELMARMRVALRHRARVSDGALESAFSVGELHVDLAARRVTVGGAQVHLTPIEYRLLVALVHHPGKVITHRQLLQEVWGPQSTEQAHYLRVYMAHLRRKLEADAARPRYLLTEAGVGYRLAAE